ncbi:MAG: polysaccharide deacetylase family protein [Deltaproteobacteria bacterium]|nr:polysaccharide deacetylase family protein [Deltaproteobacteria bacterium]
MAIEIKSRTDHVRWPGGVRLPVVLTFEHQSGEGAPLFPGDRPNYMVGGTIQYGARRGIWNILELLDKYQVKATFFVCGTTAEKYPDAVQAAQKSGHEIAGMSYSFESVRTSSTDRERSIIRRSVQVLEGITGKRIQGWRCPDYRISPQTHDILAEEGFAWDSSMLNDDLPYLFDCGARRLVEIPFSTSTADKTYIGYPYPQRGGPDGLANVWNNEFEVLYGESERSPRFLILSLQTWATGRPAPLRILRQFLDRLVGHEEFWFARCGDISKWWLEHTESRGS